MSGSREDVASFIATQVVGRWGVLPDQRFVTIVVTTKSGLVIKAFPKRDNIRA